MNLGETFTAPTLANPHSVSVAYSSSNTNVAAVDATTGAVTIGTTAGKATITATFSGNESYLADEASYEITVVDPNAERWIKTAIGDITASDVFVIVGDNHAVTNDNGTTSAPEAKSVTINADALSEIPDANLQWKLTGSASAGYSFSPANDANKYLYCNTTASSKNNDNIRVGTGDRKVWEFTSDGIMKTKDTYTDRYFSKYGNQDWRGYVNTSNGAVALEFYVKQGGSSTPTKTLSSISVTPPTKIAYTVGEAFDATGMVVTATYSDATTADVTASVTTDFATQVSSAGNKTVTVSYTEDSVTATGSFAITVSASTGSTTANFVFNTDAGIAVLGIEKPALSDGTKLEGPYTIDGVTMAVEHASTDTRIWNASGTLDLRIYKNGGKLTFTAPTGKVIKTIVITGGATNVFTVNPSGYNNGTWSGSANSVSFTATGTGKINTIAVTYQ